MDPYLYQYAIGTTVFLVGTSFAWRQGYVGFSGQGLKNLLLIFGGLAAFAGLQGWLQYAPMGEAPEVAYSGGAEGVGEDDRIGTNLDYGIMVAYFMAMLAIGTWFGRNQKGTKDFFFGGQRFSWWLISFSLIATTIGSYSFVKYSKIAYTYGIASSQTYLNDWFWIPLMLFGWLPILYFSRVVSIPEYFERRFDSKSRRIATWLLLVYLVGYVGINLFTMGKALHHLLGWDVFWAATGVASISAVYVTFGGQTSVIMTDLFQGVMLLATGMIILWLGMDHLGGAGAFWEHLPRSHRAAFVDIEAASPSYHSIGIFWQDGMANTAMFFFLNQGMAMRLLAARSVKDSRKAVITTLVVLMPVAAVVVASGGWVGRALVHAGEMPPMEAARSFYLTAEFLAQPGVFGLIMAALTAALMSTVDTLITAVAAIAVNDIYRPSHPDVEDRQLLTVARYTSVGVTLFGVALVPVFASFDSIYSAHGAFTAAVTPPLVIALLFGVFWKRFTPAAARLTMIGGSVLILASMFFPSMIAPFVHASPAPAEIGEGLLAGMDQFKFMRAFYGLTVCAVIGVVATLFTRPRALEEVKGLVWGTVTDAIAHYKGSPGVEGESDWAQVQVVVGTEDVIGQASLPVVHISRALADAISAGEQDLVYVSDARAWLGGLRSAHGVVGSVEEGEGMTLRMGPAMHAVVVPPSRKGRPLRVKRLY